MTTAATTSTSKTAATTSTATSAATTSTSATKSTSSATTTTSTSTISVSTSTSDCASSSCASSSEDDECEPLGGRAFPSVVLSGLKLPPSWNFRVSDDDKGMTFYKVKEIQSASNQPLKISHTISINPDYSWFVFVHNYEVKLSCSALRSIPRTIDNGITMNKLQVCAGHPDVSFVDFCKSKKGKLVSKTGDEVVAHVDSYLPISLNGMFHAETIRTNDCDILVNDSKCFPCQNYRKTIRLLCSRWSKKTMSSGDSSSCRGNDRYLNTPDKVTKIDSLRKRVRKAQIELKKLTEKVDKLIDQGKEIDQQVHSDLIEVMNNHSGEVYKQFPEGSFARVFWDQQLSNAKVKSPRQYRWHPLVVKWCLNMRLMSGCTYHAMRTAGFVTLPSERTLRDYTNYIKAAPGLQPEVIEQMIAEAKISDLPMAKRYVTILIDEMKIKEDLVFDKHSCTMIGFGGWGLLMISYYKLNKERRKLCTHQLLTISWQ